MKTFIHNDIMYMVKSLAFECFPIIVLEGGSRYKIIDVLVWGNKNPSTPTVSYIIYKGGTAWRPRSGTRKWAIAHNLMEDGFRNVFVARRKKN